MNLIRRLKKFFSFIIILLAVTIVILVSKISVNFLHYIRASGQAKIATWSFNVSKPNIQKIKLENSSNNDTISENYIAPGCEGEFNIKVELGASNVGASYKVKFENETKKPTNLKFIYNEKIINTLKELEPFLEGQILVNEEVKEKFFNIKWIWKFETGENREEINKNDKIDTEDAKNIKEYSFDVIVEGTQIIP